jgi:TolB-like protein
MDDSDFTQCVKTALHDSEDEDPDFILEGKHRSKSEQVLVTMKIISNWQRAKILILKLKLLFLLFIPSN